MNVSNDQHRWIQLSFFSIERCQSFIELCSTNDDLPAAERVRIECMQRLAEFQHDVIGDVGNIVDGADAKIFQAGL